MLSHPEVSLGLSYLFQHRHDCNFRNVRQKIISVHTLQLLSLECSLDKAPGHVLVFFSMHLSSPQDLLPFARWFLQPRSSHSSYWARFFLSGTMSFQESFFLPLTFLSRTPSFCLPKLNSLPAKYNI